MTFIACLEDRTGTLAEVLRQPAGTLQERNSSPAIYRGTDYILGESFPSCRGAIVFSARTRAMARTASQSMVA
jgi:hypothetical protein